MKFTATEKRNGEISVRRLSEKAQTVYNSSDPVEVYELDGCRFDEELEEKMFVLDFCGEEYSPMTIGQLETELESLYDELFADDDDDPTYYEYSDLLAAVKENPTEKNVNKLGKWFDLYGNDYWNGEYYDADSFRVFRVYEEIEPDEFEVTGYEIR